MHRFRAHGIGALAVGLAFAAGSWFGVSSALAVPERASPYANLEIFSRALSHIELAYVDDVDQDKLIYGAIRGMVQTLDPHTEFMEPREFRILTDDTEGAFGGVGIEIQAKDGWLVVMTVFEGSPAAEAGVVPGDRFLTIGNRDARDMRIIDAVQLMRGEPGTSVVVRLRRASVATAVELSLKRRVIQMAALETKVLPSGIVYVKIKSFTDTTTRELRRALDRAVTARSKSGGVRGVLLDLRNNAGGLLDQAVLVADEFLEGGVIVSTRGRGGKVLAEAKATREGTRPAWPMVVLVNGYSASASEIVAAALRDRSRAVLVGQRTFGKGSVQTLIELPDESGLKLTIARYYTPLGRSIQAVGVTPDLVLPLPVAPAAKDGATPAATPTPVEEFTEASLDHHLAAGAGGEPSPALTAAQEHAIDVSASVPVPKDVLVDDVDARRGVAVLTALAAP